MINMNYLKTKQILTVFEFQHMIVISIILIMQSCSKFDLKRDNPNDLRNKDNFDENYVNESFNPDRIFLPPGKLIEIKGGAFIMGAGKGQVNYDTDELPIHSVTLNDFCISKYEITNSQFATFLQAYGQSYVKSGEFAGQFMVAENHIGGLVYDGKIWYAATGKENHPVINVTWYGANEFCRYYNGRLPTEAEWEYAARGGINYTDNLTYSGHDNIGVVAWYWGNSFSESNNLFQGKGSIMVGTKLPNQLGICDMSGNVWEWCSDWYDKYSAKTQADPTGPNSGKYRVLRGGAWDRYYDLGVCRVSDRNYNYPINYSFIIGFRYVR